MQPEGIQVSPLADSAKGWHNLQLAVMGFIGFCGVLKMGAEPSGPAWLGQWSAGMTILAFVTSLASTWMVGTVAFPLYEDPAAQMSPGRLKTGIKMTFVSIALMALAGLAGWWPAGGEKVEVTDGSGASACGEWVSGAPTGSLWLRTEQGTITINIQSVADMQQVGSC